MESACCKKRKPDGPLPCYNDIRAGKPQGNSNPLFVVLDIIHNEQPITGDYQYTKWQNSLKQAIQGYNKCDLVHFYMNNLGSFITSNYTGFIGVNIEEIPSTNVQLATKFPTNGATNREYAIPNWVVPRYFPHNLTNDPLISPDGDSYSFFETTLHQFPIDVSTETIQTFSVSVLDGSTFWILNRPGSAPAPINFECRLMLRFYNTEDEKRGCQCNK